MYLTYPSDFVGENHSPAKFLFTNGLRLKTPKTEDQHAGYCHHGSRKQRRIGDAEKEAATLTGKSPNGRTPMMSSVFTLMTRPRIFASTLPCISVITKVPKTLCAAAINSSIANDGAKLRLSAKIASAITHSAFADTNSGPFRR